MTTTAQTRTAELLALEDAWGAHNYHPLPIVVGAREGRVGDRRRAGAAISTV